ncbi:MAG: ERF family protein [Dorea sp.]|nr:ERF family protein [Dorea sp.]
MSAERMPMIYSAVCGVMSDIGAVGKDGYNRTQNFKYRGVEAIMNALNPAMIKNKVFCTPEVLEQNREERTTSKGASLLYSVCRIRYRFFTTDGSYVDAVVVGEGMDSGDKATNKAMSVAFKYACFQTFCIPTENLMDDPDADTPGESHKDASAGQKQDGKGASAAQKQGKKGAGSSSGQEGNDGSKKQQGGLDKERKALMEELSRELVRTGYVWGAVMKTYKVESVEALSKLQVKDCISKMKKQPDKAVS